MELCNLLIDTDYVGTLPAFYRAINEHGIKVCDIDYVLATHYHPDHIGLVSELIKQGVKLLLLDTQHPYIHFSDEILNRDMRLKSFTMLMQIKGYRKYGQSTKSNLNLYVSDF